jgi:hypothetical protein
MQSKKRRRKHLHLVVRAILKTEYGVHVLAFAKVVNEVIPSLRLMLLRVCWRRRKPASILNCLINKKIKYE